MRATDLLTIATTALGTATLMLAGFWAGPIDAGNDTESPPAKITQARFASRGAQLALAPAGGRTFKAGDQPEFELTAHNTTEQPVSTAVCITMTASAPASVLSRAIQLPSVLWQCEQVVELQARETKLLTVCAETNLPPNSVINVSLREPGPQNGPGALGITALSFSTVVPKAAPMVVTLK